MESPKKLISSWIILYHPLTLLLILCVLIPAGMEGMFFDGLTYSSISRNLSINEGTFWHPFYTETSYPKFYEQPPLLFWIQSFFFTILGKSKYVEKLFSILVLLFILGASYLIIKEIAKPYQSTKRILKWSIAGFILSEPVLWGITFNLLDSLLCLFCLMSVWSFLISIKTKRISWFFIGSFFSALGFFTKGLVAFFPCVVCSVYFLVFRSKNLSFLKSVVKALVLLLASILSVSFLIGFVLLNEDAYINIETYFNSHVIAAVTGQRTNISDSLSIVYVVKYLSTSTIHLVLIGWFIKKVSTNRGDSKNSFKIYTFLMILGLSASLPLAISSKIRNFYFIPSIPYFSMLFGFYCAGFSSSEVESKSVFSKFNYKLVFSLVLVGAIFFRIFYTRGYRDKAVIGLMKESVLETLKGKTIGTCKAMSEDYKLVAYIQRYHRISLKPTKQRNWKITGKLCDKLLVKTYKIID